MGNHTNDVVAAAFRAVVLGDESSGSVGQVGEAIAGVPGSQDLLGRADEVGDGAFVHREGDVLSHVLSAPPSGIADDDASGRHRFNRWKAETFLLVEAQEHGTAFEDLHRGRLRKVIDGIEAPALEGASAFEDPEHLFQVVVATAWHERECSLFGPDVL